MQFVKKNQKPNQLVKRKNNMKKVVPKTKQGKIAVKRLGRTKKTGGFAKIAKSVRKKYGSKETGKRVAGAIYWGMVKKRKGKK